jgi:hypothetical protein
MMGAHDASSSRLSPDMLALKSQKWIQMQKKRYGEKRKGGYVDMGKQVRRIFVSVSTPDLRIVGPSARTCPKNHQGPWRHEQPQISQ